MFRLFQHLVTSALQLAIDHDDNGITFDIYAYDPNRLGNSFPFRWILVFRSVHLMGNQTKVFQDLMSLHNVTNPDKLKLVNYNHKICNTEIF